MITKIDNSGKIEKKSGGFGIDILYPGTIFPDTNDTGIATIGRIDHARIMPGTLVPMHPHRDDEILTYLRSGKVKHSDTVGRTEVISSQRLMLMNAGREFQHEELVLEESDTLRGLQIFIRPEKGGMEPNVQFHDFSDVYSVNRWRKVAGKGQDFPLTFRSETSLYDIRLEKGITRGLPALPREDVSLLFYLFKGEMSVNNNITLKTGESLFIKQEKPEFRALVESDIVLFVTDRDAPYFDSGMYSGNKEL